jgi:hypothetical protein
MEKQKYYDILIESNNPEILTIRRDQLNKLMPETKEVLFLLLEYPIEIQFWIESIHLQKKKTSCCINKRSFKKFLLEIYSGKYLQIFDEISFLIKTMNR